MEHELGAVTEAGGLFIALAEEMAADFAATADAHDREGSFPFENLEALKRSGILYAPVPVEHGGMGVDSAHDLLVGSSRLARGDASLTLGVNMHLVTLMSLVRQWRIALNRGDERRTATVGATMEDLVRSGAAIAAAVSEPDQDLTRPSTTARRNGAGWVIEGRKIFTSMAPAATHFSTSVLYTDEAGEERYAYALVPRDTPGLAVNDDWDALGMRGSGSVSLTLRDAHVERGPGRGAPAGIVTAEWLEQVLLAGPAHASSSLGVAEAAHQIALDGVAARRQRQGEASVRATVRQLAAENSVDVSAMRGIFGRALQLIDEYYAAHPTGFGTVDEANAIFAEAQRAKAFINQAAVRVVDRALTITGGASYMSRHPLSRLYRDVRAGAFMHPLGAHVAYEYIGDVTLGMTPRL